MPRDRPSSLTPGTVGVLQLLTPLDEVQQWCDQLCVSGAYMGHYDDDRETFILGWHAATLRGDFGMVHIGLDYLIREAVPSAVADDAAPAFPVVAHGIER